VSRTAVVDSAEDTVADIADRATILVSGLGMAGMPTTLIDALIDQAPPI
jgi:3-oxoadipate CoA-transferase alpha subunit